MVFVLPESALFKALSGFCHVDILRLGCHCKEIGYFFEQFFACHRIFHIKDRSVYSKNIERGVSNEKKRLSHSVTAHCPAYGQ